MYKVIKTVAEHQDALSEIDKLMDLDPEIGSPEGDRLELLILLVKDYESQKYVIGQPDPIDAIVFRMEQQGLTQRDLIPYIGSKSKVSEVLSRKRPLTLSMIRALQSNLGIPAQVLIEASSSTVDDIEWERFPIAEMQKRGWITPSTKDLRRDPESELSNFFAPLGGPSELVRTVRYRRSRHIRSARTMDEYALIAWTGRIANRVKEIQLSPYTSGTVSLEFMTQVARLSINEDGPRKAQEMLQEAGIVLVIEPHLPRTNLDGAAILIEGFQNPIIGLSIRYDRLDNFWFCLMHELAHISLHLDKQNDVPEVMFFDDLDLVTEESYVEKEADKFAREALIPQDVWNKSPAKYVPSQDAALLLAQQLSIHPAIVAGRIRYEMKAFRVLNNLVGHYMVRKWFPNVQWGAKK